MPNPKKVLLVDNDDAARNFAIIINEDYSNIANITITADLEDAENLLKYEFGIDYFDFFIIDLQINFKYDGWNFAKNLVKDMVCPEEKIIIYSAQMDVIIDEMKKDHPNMKYIDKREDETPLTKALRIFTGDDTF
ncbi:MAG: hypothetical protein FWD82_06695 [Defluviitaleaceae bacterium]|nr:hypothetical protein [Defluviitaleaceae bacterium]